MSDTDAALAALTSLRQLGVRVALDDFGTGYSSLAYLKKFPIDVVKIDKYFVSALGHDANDTLIVAAIINLAHTLGLTVVADGSKMSRKSRSSGASTAVTRRVSYGAGPSAPSSWAGAGPGRPARPAKRAGRRRPRSSPLPSRARCSTRCRARQQ